jgi:hypothetical protein
MSEATLHPDGSSSPLWPAHPAGPIVLVLPSEVLSYWQGGSPNRAIT